MGDERQHIIDPGAAAAAALAVSAAPRIVTPSVVVVPPPGSAAIDRPGIPPGAPSRFNPGQQGPEWGSPMHELISAEGTSQGTVEDGDAAQESSNAWGRQANVTPGGPKVGVIRVFCKRSQDFTLSIDVIQEAVADLVQRVPVGQNFTYVWAQVTFGNGGTNITRNVRCDYRIDLPLVGSFIDVLLYIGDIEGNPIDPSQLTDQNSQSAIVHAQLSRGVRGLPYSATLFTVDYGNTTLTTGNSVLNSPQRLMSVSAHLGADAQGDRFLQLWDTTTAVMPPSAADNVPTAEWALGSTPKDSSLGFGRILVAPRGFCVGLVWVVSSTAGKYTSCSDSIWIELETQLL